MPASDFTTIDDYVGSQTERGSQVDPQSAASIADYITAYQDYLTEVQTEEVVDEQLFDQPQRYLFGVDASVFQQLADVQDEAQVEFEQMYETEDEDIISYLDKGLETFLRENNPTASDESIKMWVSQRDFQGASSATPLDALISISQGIRESIRNLKKAPLAGATTSEQVPEKMKEFVAYFQDTKELREKALQEIPSRWAKVGGLVEPYGKAKQDAAVVPEGSIAEKDFSRLDEVFGTLQERGLNLQSKQQYYQVFVNDAIDAVFRDTGLSRMSAGKVETYYGRGMAGYDRTDPTHIEEMSGMGTWGWRDLAIQQLYEKGKEAVEQGIYGHAVNLDNSTIRQFIDITLSTPETLGAVGERGLMDILSQINFDNNLRSANDLTAYTMERIGNAYASRLADVANRSNTDLLGLYNSGRLTSDERVAKYQAEKTPMQENLGIDVQAPMAEWNEVMFNFQRNVEQAFFGGVGALGQTAVIPQGEATRRGSSSLTYLPAGTKEYGLSQSTTPAIRGFFGPIGTGPSDDASTMKKAPAKEKETPSGARRLQFPSWRYLRRSY